MAGLSHEITVDKFRELLDSLKSTDILVPNGVRNLVVLREDIPWGYLDLYEDKLEIFDEEAKPLDSLVQKINRGD